MGHFLQLNKIDSKSLMSAKSTALFFVSGVYLSTYMNKRQRYVWGPSVASFSMLYGGSYYEFDNLVAEQQIKPSSLGFWIIGGGVLSAGVAAGNAYRRLFNN